MASAAERRANARQAATDLKLIESKLEHAIAALPAMLREVQRIRGVVEAATTVESVPDPEASDAPTT